MANQRQMSDMCNVKCGPTKQCIPQEMVIENVQLAAAYVPFQYLCDLFNPLEALKKGTAFPELYSPYDTKPKRYRACPTNDYYK